MKVGVGYNNLLQDFRFMKSVLKITMDVWRKENVYKIERFKSLFLWTSPATKPPFKATLFTNFLSQTLIIATAEFCI